MHEGRLMGLIETLKKPFQKRPSHIEVFVGKDEKWYFRVVAVNGKIAASSQGYSTKSNAIRAARNLHPTLVVETKLT